MQKPHKLKGGVIWAETWFSQQTVGVAWKFQVLVAKVEPIVSLYLHVLV